MHASLEDVKVIMQIFNPKYFIPINGEYQHFISNPIEVDMSMRVENIPIIDNGEKSTLKNGVLEEYRDTYEVEDVMIDGIGVGDVGESH